MTNLPTLAIIGGGASGMAAAITAAAYPVRVVLYEAQDRVGRKLLATGNGRCNFSHVGFADANYHGTHPHFVHEALARFDEASTLAFFEELGLAWTVDGRKRYYPASLQAQAVLDVLRLALEERGVKLCLGTRIRDICPQKDGFALLHKAGADHVDAVIVCTGGEAAPKLGGTRDGYALLEKLGHQMVATAPAVVQLVCDVQSLKAANGMKRDAGVAIVSDGRVLARDEGELLITNYGVSGPPVLQCAGAAVRALARGERVQIVLDFFPGQDAAQLESALLDRHERFPKRTAEQYFVGLLPRLLAQCAIKACGFKMNQPLTPAQVKRLAAQLHAWPLAVTDSRGFGEAQITQGGIDTADFDEKRLASWIVPGLYAAGEVLDIDGDCGGYNLQWAWSSGRLAAESAVSELLNI